MDVPIKNGNAQGQHSLERHLKLEPSIRATMKIDS